MPSFTIIMALSEGRTRNSFEDCQSNPGLHKVKFKSQVPSDLKRLLLNTVSLNPPSGTFVIRQKTKFYEIFH